MRRALAPVLMTALISGCLAPRMSMPQLATTHVTSDFGSYRIQRVGLLPFAGDAVTHGQGKDLQAAFLSEVSRAASFELVLLDESDLEEIEASEPYRRGWYSPRTIIGLSQRYSLDAVFFGTVTQLRYYPPQVFSLQVDMVSAETGMVIWTSAVHLDANDPRVLDGLRIYYEAEGDEEAWQLALVSPERFARFAAYMIANRL